MHVSLERNHSMADVKRSIVRSWCIAWPSLPTRSLRDCSPSDWRLARHGSCPRRARCRTRSGITIVEAEGNCTIRWSFFWEGKWREKRRRKERKKNFFRFLSTRLSFRPDEAFSSPLHASPPDFRAMKNSRQVCRSFRAVRSNDSWIHEGIKEYYIYETLCWLLQRASAPVYQFSCWLLEMCFSFTIF